MPLAFSAPLLADMVDWLQSAGGFIQVIIGFSIIIFFHELGHFIAAKWVGVRVHRFAVGFGPRLCGFRSGEGFTFGSRPEYSADELEKKRYGETDYCFNLLPIGGYVKMLGSDDIFINEETGDIKLTTDPRAFNNRPVGQRAIVVSAGVVFNLLLAALLIIIVFMIGMKAFPPTIGIVAPSGPAAGKLEAGDRILSIGGKPCRSFDEIHLALLLAPADKPLSFDIERDGKPLHLEITPVLDTQAGVGEIGIAPLFGNTLSRDGLPVAGKENVRAGDSIVAVDDKPVANSVDIWNIFRNTEGRPLKVLVHRPDPSSKFGYREVECYQRAELLFSPALLKGEKPAEEVTDSRHLLGFLRRQAVNFLEPDYPAMLAGIKVGDIVTEWAGQANPKFSEIVRANRAADGRPMHVTVLRDGAPHSFEIVPKTTFTMTGAAPPPRVGIGFGDGGEENGAVVADIAPGSPAAALKMPRGSTIIAIDGRPMVNWFDVAKALLAAAGREVTVRYRTGGDEAEGRMPVPSSLVNELGLTPSADVLSINGQETIKVDLNGQSTTLPLYNNAPAIRLMLAKHVGETVKIRFRQGENKPVETADFRVRADNIDPWQLRVRYDYDRTAFAPVLIPLQTSNPIEAVAMGVRRVKQLVESMYVSLGRVATNNASVENLSGPVGIVRIGVDAARDGLAKLLLLLAILSVNLAVINFLPIPVMDGGLMVFLLIEKIKGKPLSLKTQMYTTLVGLAAIILIGIFVTVQDVGRWLF